MSDAERSAKQFETDVNKGQALLIFEKELTQVGNSAKAPQLTSKKVQLPRMI